MNLPGAASARNGIVLMFPTQMLVLNASTGHPSEAASVGGLVLFRSLPDRGLLLRLLNGELDKRLH